MLKAAPGLVLHTGVLRTSKWGTISDAMRPTKHFLQLSMIDCGLLAIWLSKVVKHFFSISDLIYLEAII
uniref:Uncharacterized protein n=1 Tax=Romanomermis culicivorax TaxID=13658 RepID=A0A915L8J1_ROMCU